MQAQGWTRFPDEIDAAGKDKKARRDPDTRRRGEREACQGNEEEANLRSVKVGQKDAGRLTHHGLHRVCRSLLAVESVGASLDDQPGGDVKRQKVLKLDIARAVKETGGCKVDGTDSPQAQSENHHLRAKAAWVQPLRGGFNPWGCGLRRTRVHSVDPLPVDPCSVDLRTVDVLSVDHGAGSAFLRASSSLCPEPGALCARTMRQPSS